MSMKESKRFWSRKRSRGQSIVEFAMMAPILLILLSGLFEFGFLFSNYLAVLDAARNAARFSSDSQFNINDGILDCGTTQDFYRQTACEAVDELANEQPTITLCLPVAPFPEHCSGVWPDVDDGMDDVIISVFSVLRASTTPVPPEIVRFPLDAGDMGWSYDADLAHQSQDTARTGMHVSNYTTEAILHMLQPGTPNTGYVLVEINYHYHQVLALPWFTQFVHDPIPLHLYALWPCVSAEPTSTPK